MERNQANDVSAHAFDGEAQSSGGLAQLLVVGQESVHGPVATEHESGRQVNAVQRPDHSGERLFSPE